MEERKSNDSYVLIILISILVLVKIMLISPNSINNNVYVDKQKMINECISGITNSENSVLIDSDKYANCYCNQILKDVNTSTDLKLLYENLKSGNIEKYMPAIKICYSDMSLNNLKEKPIKSHILEQNEKRAFFLSCKSSCEDENKKEIKSSSISIEKYCDCQCTSITNLMHTNSDIINFANKVKNNDKEIMKIGIQCAYKIPELKKLMEEN